MTPIIRCRLASLAPLFALMALAGSGRGQLAQARAVIGGLKAVAKSYTVAAAWTPTFRFGFQVNSAWPCTLVAANAAVTGPFGSASANAQANTGIFPLCTTAGVNRVTTTKAGIAVAIAIAKNGFRIRHAAESVRVPLDLSALTFSRVQNGIYRLRVAELPIDAFSDDMPSIASLLLRSRQYQAARARVKAEIHVVVRGGSVASVRSSGLGVALGRQHFRTVGTDIQYAGPTQFGIDLPGDTDLALETVSTVGDLATGVMFGVDKPCGSGAHQISGGFPRIGHVQQVWGGGPGMPGILYLGAPLPGGLPIGGCRLYLDFKTPMIPLGAFRMAEWEIRTPIPKSEALVGLDIAIQAVQLGKGGLLMTNALFGRIGAR